jgi:hypothetical protein
VAGALAVGPNSGDLSWWSNDDATVTARDCLFDDTFVFAEDGGFSQDMGTETWLEGWQGSDPEACGTPVAPHDGSATDHTFAVVDGKGLAASTVTVTGLGAHLGLAKVYNGGELQAGQDVAETAGTAISYNVTELSADGKSMTVQIQYSGAQTWQFKFAKQDEVDPTPTTSITIPVDKKAQGVDKVIDTDDDVMVKGSYVSGSLTFVRPPVGSEAAAADWCPDGGNACAARDTWRLGNNLYFRRMDHGKAVEWCESQNGRLATRQEITDHLIPIIPESEGGNGVWETQLYWPEQASKYWTADKSDDGTKAFVFTTRNYGTGAAVYHLTNQETITDKWIWPMCVGG